MGRLTEDSDKVFFEAIGTERLRQDTKWGDQSGHNGLKWLSILVEEVGELAQAILENRREDAKKELIEVAAVACGAYSFCFKDLDHDRRSPEAKEAERLREQLNDVKVWLEDEVGDGRCKANPDKIPAAELDDDEHCNPPCFMWQAMLMLRDWQ